MTAWTLCLAYFHSWLLHRHKSVHTVCVCQGEDALVSSTKPQLSVLRLLSATLSPISVARSNCQIFLHAPAIGGHVPIACDAAVGPTRPLFRPPRGCRHPDWQLDAATLSCPTAKCWHFGIMAYSLLPWYRRGLWNVFFTARLLHITYSFWGRSPQTPTGALSLDPAGGWGTSVPQTPWSAITPPVTKF